MTTMNKENNIKRSDNMSKEKQSTEEFLDNWEIFLEENKLYISPKRKQAIIKAQAEIFKKNQEARKTK